MKKLMLPSLAIVVILLNAITLLPTKAFSEIKPIVCKVEVVDCPGWGTGDRQICHQNGSGLTCVCGASTNCP